MAKINYTPLGVKPGDKFGKLTVLRDSGQRNSRMGKMWLCLCDCGNEKLADASHLTWRHTTSCGCLKRELDAGKVTKLTEKRQLIDGTCLSDLQKGLSKNNTSGIKGVTFHRRSGKWYAQMFFKGKHYWLGQFDTKEAAAQARRDAELKYFAPILHEHGMSLTPQEIDRDMIKDDTYKRRPFYDFGKGIQQD